jgi:hypothetical protein
MSDQTPKADSNPCLDINRAEHRTGREIYLEGENDRMYEIIGQIKQYLGGCEFFGDEPELDTLIELVGGVDP